jgi:hypothetical protein
VEAESVAVDTGADIENIEDMEDIEGITGIVCSVLCKTGSVFC